MNFSRFGLACLACAALASAACSTVIKTGSGFDENAGSAEREALRAAAADVARAPWPKPSSSSLAERLTGASPDGESVSRNDAVDAYVGRLRQSAAPEAGLLADADRHLESARALTSAAEEATETSHPRLSDVALVEDAIADLRETRAIYVASIKELDADDDRVDLIKKSFDVVIRDLGDVADDLAKSAMQKSSANFAGPARVAGGK